MIPIILCMILILSDAATAFADSQQSAPTLPATEAPEAPMAPEARATAKAPAAAETAAATACLRSGDGYFRARVAGAVEATIDWPNSGTRCEGEPRDKPPGVRLSFQRASGGPTDLLFVFGITGVREGQPLHEAGANLTVIVQGTNRIFGTLGDSRCTVDSLTQRALEAPGSYRLEARGFCTQPAHAVRGDGAVLVSTFEFAGLVTYDTQKN
jgi:nucleoid-associated protein YgaU